MGIAICQPLFWTATIVLLTSLFFTFISNLTCRNEIPRGIKDGIRKRSLNKTVFVAVASFPAQTELTLILYFSFAHNIQTSLPSSPGEGGRGQYADRAAARRDLSLPPWGTSNRPPKEDTTLPMLCPRDGSGD